MTARLSDLGKTRLRWSLGALVAAAVAAGIIALVMFLGGFDAAANRPWSQLATWLIHRTMVNSAHVRSRTITPPAAFIPAQVQEGFRLYDAHCAMCHGGPGLARQPWTSGLEPSPPYLLDVSRLLSRRDLFWIVHNGVKMTAMPAWDSQLSTTDIWNVVAFLEALPHLTTADYARMRQTLHPTAPRPARPEPVASPPGR